MSETQLQELAAAGLTPDDVAAEPVEIWPENLQAYQLFESLSTQWRSSAAGPTGMDYLVLYHKMDRMRLSEEEYAQLETDIRVMEQAALACIYAKE